MEQSGGRNVFVVRDGIAERRAVRLGDSSLEAIEVLEGLAPGENVVIAGTDLFQDSSRVRIND